MRTKLLDVDSAGRNSPGLHLSHLYMALVRISLSVIAIFNPPGSREVAAIVETVVTAKNHDSDMAAKEFCERMRR